MPKKQINILRKIKFLVLFCVFLFSQAVSFANIDTLTQKYFKNIYNYKFEDAFSIIKIIEKENPTKITTRNILYANYYMYLYEKNNKKQDIDSCKYFCKSVVLNLDKKTKLSENEVFEYITAKSILIKILISEKKQFYAISELVDIYDYIVYATENYSKNEKLKLTAGIYFYYAELASEDYPFLYSLMYFLPKGNKKLGLKLLEECSASKNIYVQAESLYYLARIWHRDEKNFKISQKYYLKLLNFYPRNIFWRKEYLKLLKKDGASYKIIKKQENLLEK